MPEDLITIVVGLPGSGKTHYIRKISDGRLVLDDVESPDEFPDSMQGMVLTHPVLCKKECLENMIESIYKKYGTIGIEVIYFENDLNSCLKNLQKRSEDGINQEAKNFARNLHRHYYPENPTIPVWKQEG